MLQWVSKSKVEEVRLCLCWPDMRKLTYGMQEELGVHADQPTVCVRMRACGKEACVREREVCVINEACKQWQPQQQSQNQEGSANKF